MTTSTATTATSTVGDLTAALDFLTRHPNLPVPLSITVYPPGKGNGGISITLDTAAQVGQWAAALGLDVEALTHFGNTQYVAHRIGGDLPVSAVAFVPNKAVSA